MNTRDAAVTQSSPPPSNHLSPDSIELGAFGGSLVPSQTQNGVNYRLEYVIGEGTASVAFFGMRLGPEGETPVVLKVTRPSFLSRMGEAAMMMIRKEAVALGRLNERVPTTPFVVRLLDSGSVAAPTRSGNFEVPWNAVEYVHGGVEGTALHERVDSSLQVSGYAFDLRRAAHFVHCVSEGLEAIHAVSVIHRDISPGNVLCCGADANEVFKIADFGIARPVGLGQTFGENAALGTPGYAAPEQLFPGESQIGPWTDVFSFACLVYLALTGEDYFQIDGPVEAIIASREPARRRLTDTAGLCPELKAQPDACAAIDQLLARATSNEIQARPQSARELAALLSPHLEEAPMSHAGGRRFQSLMLLSRQAEAPSWSWTLRQRPQVGFIAREVSWDGDGRCLALTTSGLWFWTGSEWQMAPTHGLDASRLRFVSRQAAGRWLLGGEEGLLCTYDASGARKFGEQSRKTVFERAHGDPNDIAVVAGSRDDSPALLFCVIAGRWLKPAALPKAANITALARVADEEWLVTGRDVQGEGFVARYRPLMWESARIQCPKVRAYLGAAGHPVLGVGLAVGAAGTAVTLRGELIEQETLDASADFSVTALDSVGGAWTASRGALWYRAHTPGAGWVRTWGDNSLQTPFVSLLAHEGQVVAMTVDGAVLEGRRTLEGRREQRR